MKKINARLDSISSPFNNIAPWFFRIALGIAFFLHGYKKLPAPFMMEEQHRMVTWFESIFIPMPEVFVSTVILVEILGGAGIILGGLISGHIGNLITRISGGAVGVIMIGAIVIAHADWLVTKKLFMSEQIFLFLLGTYFAIKGND